MLQFGSIKPRHFGQKVLKLQHKARVKIALCLEALMFGKLDKEMKIEDKNGSDKNGDKNV